MKLTRFNTLAKSMVCAGLLLSLILPMAAEAFDKDKPFGKGVTEAEKIAKKGGIEDKQLSSNSIISFLSIILFALGTIALFVLIIGGVMYILSFGNEERAKLAKRIIIYAIVGLLVIGTAGIITNLIIAVLQF